MCPMCLSTLGWIALGGGTGTGALAALILAVRRRNHEEENND
jgi:hypothetical protein